MPARRAPQAVPPVRNGENGGEISSFGKFRDRLLLWLAATLGSAVVAGMMFFVHASQLQTDQVRADAREQGEVLRRELGELRDRLNAELASHAAFTAGQTTQDAEVIRRLNQLETKVDLIRSKP